MTQWNVLLLFSICRSMRMPTIIWVVLDRARVNSQDLFGLQQILKARYHSDGYFTPVTLYLFSQEAHNFTKWGRRKREVQEKEEMNNSPAEIYFNYKSARLLNDLALFLFNLYNKWSQLKVRAHLEAPGNPEIVLKLLIKVFIHISFHGCFQLSSDSQFHN